MRAFMQKFFWGIESIVLIATGVLLIGCRERTSSPLNALPNEPSQPRLGLELVTQVPLTRTRSVAISNGYAFVARNFDGMSVLDFSNPASPRLLSHVPPTVVQPLDLAAGSRPNLLFAADRFRGLVSLDISRPSSPTTCSQLQLPGIATGLRVFTHASREYVAVACGVAGLQIVDVTDPSQPSRVSSFTLGTDYATDVVVANGYAMLANNDEGGLELFSLCESLEIKPLCRVHVPGYCVGLDVKPPLVAAALRNGGVALLRIDALLQPARDCAASTPPIELIARVSRYPDYVHKAVFLDSNKLAVANNDNGVQLYDVSDAHMPVLEDTLDVPGDVVSLVPYKNYLVACAWNGGLIVLRFAERRDDSVSRSDGRSD
jgi:hypothetical protein